MYRCEPILKVFNNYLENPYDNKMTMCQIIISNKNKFWESFFFNSSAA